MRIFLIIIMTLTLPLMAFSQFKLPEFKAESGVIVSAGENAPFWLTNNRYGIFTPANHSGIIDLALIAKPDTGKFFDYSYGLEVVERYNNEYKNQLFLQQGYLETRVWFVNLRAGWKKETIGNEYTSLSSGSLLWSSNARPLPKITIETDGYTDVPFTYGYLEFKGGWSHGWFNDDRHVENALLHHKYLYGRIGGSLPVTAHYGFHHYAQWGGDSPEYGEQPATLDDFYRIFLAETGDSADSHENDVINALGNHIGSRNIGLDVKTERYRMKAYWQTIFEDNSGKAWRNIRDGLWGLALISKEENKMINGILYEFMHTRDQSGPSHNAPDGSILGGNDNYFNNWLFRSGWSYHQRTIGNPFITSPIYNNNGSIRFLNNKVILHHLGIEGQILDKVNYEFLLSYSLNYGKNASPYSKPKEQYAAYMNCSLPIREPFDFKLNASAAMDFGEMYGNNIGIYLSAIKNINL